MDKLAAVLKIRNAIQIDIRSKEKINATVVHPKSVYENDYEKLKNLPTLNGEKFIGDVNEIDPTVPGWAKENSKPNYTPEEIGALGEDDEMSASTMVEIWQSIFN